MPAPSKQQQIIDTAYELFNKNGFYATGVDLIMQEAHISKRTLYKYFPSKNQLIAAVLNHYQCRYQQRMAEIIDRQQQSAQTNILAIFREAETWFLDTHFHGCLAVNAMAEFSGKDPDIEQACVKFKRWEINLLTELCQDLGAENPEQLAYKLFILLEGMSSIAQVKKGATPVDIAQLAEEIIERHLN